MEKAFARFKGGILKHKFIWLALGLVVVIILTIVIVAVLKMRNDDKAGPTKPYNSAVADYQKKLPDLKKTAESKTKDVTAQSDYAVALYAVGNLQEAKQQYQKALNLSPNDATLLNNLANTYRDLKDYNKAVESYRESIQKSPKQLNAYMNLANLQIYTLNKVDDGIATYKKALDTTADNSQIKVLLALAYEKKGDKTAAVDLLQDILKTDPKNQAAKNNLDRLNQ